jgi:hypothetical protein
MLTLCLCAVLVLAIAVLLRAIALSRSRAVAAGGEPDMRRVLLEEEKDRALQTLRDIDLDYQLRKLSDADYAALRGDWEKRAVAAIRALEAAGGQSSGRSVARDLSSLLAVLGVLSGGADAAWAFPVGDRAAAADEARQSDKRSLRVDVLRMDPAGAMVPYGGAEVSLHWPVNDMGGATPAPAPRAAVADRAGRVEFPDLEAAGDAEIRAVTVRQGAVFVTTAKATDSRAILLAYDTTTDRAQLSVRVQARLVVSDGELQARLEYTLVNRSPRAIVARWDGEPLVLPLLAPVVGGEVLTGGWLPPQAAKNTGTDVDPAIGAAELAGGTFVYRGVILPGESTKVRLGMPLTAPGSFTELGLVASDVRIEEAVVSLEWGPKVNVRLTTAHDAWGAHFDNGGSSTRAIRLAAPLEPGEQAVFRLDHLPVEGEVRRAIAFWAAVAAVVALAVAMIRRPERPAVPRTDGLPPFAPAPERTRRA